MNPKEELQKGLDAQMLGNAASIASRPATPGMKMYLPLDPTAANMMAKEGTMPRNAFSDRATGIAYQPIPSQIRYQNGSLQKLDSMQNTLQRAPLNTLFQGPAIDRFPKQAKTDLMQSPTLDRNTNAQFRPGYSGGGIDMPATIDLNQNANRSRSQVLDDVTHEFQHRISYGDKAAPTLGKPVENLSDYENYRADPEEHLAFKAASARGLSEPGQIAEVFNAPDDEVPLYQMRTGHNKQYSQTDVTRGGTVNTIQGIKPKIAPSAMQNFSKFLSGFGKLGGIAGNALQAKQSYQGYRNASNAGASKTVGMLAPMSSVPMVERLPDGRLYNHATGETSKDEI